MKKSLNCEYLFAINLWEEERAFQVEEMPQANKTMWGECSVLSPG